MFTQTLAYAGRTTLAAALLSAACSAPEAGPSSVEDASQPIIGGVLDTTHSAVVALLTDDSACSGTIIHRNASTARAWILTAAHCGDLVQVRLGNDWNAPSNTFGVVSQHTHPDYDAQRNTYDFALVEISRTSDSLPVIPAMTSAEDDLRVNDTVTAVGYGLTSYPNGATTRRNRIDVPVTQVAQIQFATSNASGGPCSGDSGGPLLSSSTGSERVAGVVSYGDQGCAGQGVHGRVSAVYNSWIAPILGADPVEEDCDACVASQQQPNGACGSAVDACFNDTECAALNQCLTDCGSNATCQNQCVNEHAAGVPLYFSIFDCFCETGCVDECAAEPMCDTSGSPECGFGFEDATCGECADASCCDESSACAADGECYACAVSSGTSCGTNDLYNAFTGCLEGECGVECGFEDPSTGGSGGASGAAGASGSGGAGGEQTGGTSGSGGSDSSAGDGGDASNTGGAGPDDGENATDGSGELASGCGCRVGASRSQDSGYALLLVGALGALAAARRRRRHIPGNA